MDDHRSNQGFPVEDDEDSERGEQPRAAPASGERDSHLDVDVRVSFYDWRGQPLSSDERRARLAAFRSNTEPGPRVNAVDPWLRHDTDRARLPRAPSTLPPAPPAAAAPAAAAPAAVAQPAPISEPLWPPRQMVLTDSANPTLTDSANPVLTDSAIPVLTDSAIPVVGPPPPSVRPRRPAPRTLIGLAMALAVLVAIALLGLFSASPSQAPTYQSLVMAPPPAAAVPAPPSTNPEQPAPALSVALETVEPTPPAAGVAAQSSADPVATDATMASAPPAAPAPGAGDGQPRAAPPNRRPDDPKPSPPGGRTTPSPTGSTPLTIVPGDSPKF